MTSKLAAVVAAVMSIGYAESAFAQHQEDRDRAEQRADPHQKKARQPSHKVPARVAEHRDERGIGPHHEFHRGERISAEYRHRNYVVDDWRAHRLSAPPRGYHWVQVGADYALIAVTTGVILDVLLSK